MNKGVRFWLGFFGFLFATAGLMLMAEFHPKLMREILLVFVFILGAYAVGYSASELGDE